MIYIVIYYKLFMVMAGNRLIKSVSHTAALLHLSLHLDEMRLECI
mgnify:CR=1 FL=1